MISSARAFLSFRHPNQTTSDTKTKSALEGRKPLRPPRLDEPRLTSRLVGIPGAPHASSQARATASGTERSPIDQLHDLVHKANRRRMKPKQLAATVEAIQELRRSHPDRLISTHVLASVAGLGLGAMPPIDRASVEELGRHILQLMPPEHYPAHARADALLELARSVPGNLRFADRINVRLAFMQTYDDLLEASQGKFTEKEAAAFKEKVGKLEPLALD